MSRQSPCTPTLRLYLKGGSTLSFIGSAVASVNAKQALLPAAVRTLLRLKSRGPPSFSHPLLFNQPASPASHRLVFVLRRVKLQLGQIPLAADAVQKSGHEPLVPSFLLVQKPPEQRHRKQQGPEPGLSPADNADHQQFESEGAPKGDLRGE